MRIGIFGGSFNPVHNGHGMVADMIAQSGIVDEVWLMPGRINPLKIAGPAPAPPENRLDMCRLVAGKCDNVKVSDVELHLPEPSYTYDTLKELRERYHDYKFRIIIGSDNWLCFDRWRNWREIITEFGVIVYPRPGYDVTAELPENVKIVRDIPLMEVSSTFIREAIAEGKNVNFLLPDEVIGYIKEKGLYRR